MVNIKLDNIWTLQSEPKCWTLLKEGRPTLFYSNLDSAIDGYFQAKIRGSEATSIKGLQNYIKGVVASLNSALTPLSIKVSTLKTKGGKSA